MLIFEDVNIGCDEIIFKGHHLYKESIHYNVQLQMGLNKLSVLTLKGCLKLFIKNLLLNNSVHLKDEYLWIVDQYSWSYFHWFCDAIPKLLASMQVVNNPKLLLPEFYRKFDYIEESLKAFPLVDLVFIPEHSLCQVKKLFFPTPLAQSGHYNDPLMKKIRSTFREYFLKSTNMHLGERIYISRAKAGRRKILNEKDLINLLQKYRFKSIVFEDLQFKEQVAIALNTKYLVSNHGAGLTNMLFMNTASSILELRQQGDYFNNCYFALASALDIRYYYQICKGNFDSDKELILSPNLDYSLKELKYFSSFTHNSDIIVDLEKLELNLASMLDENPK